MLATTLNCGNPLRALTTSRYMETYIETQGNDLGHSKNVKDWAIRSQAPTSDIARIWRRFRDYNGLGTRDLANLNDFLRYSPSYLETCRVLIGADWRIQIDQDIFFWTFIYYLLFICVYHIKN